MEDQHKMTPFELLQLWKQNQTNPTGTENIETPGENHASSSEGLQEPLEPLQTSATNPGNSMNSPNYYTEKIQKDLSSTEHPEPTSPDELSEGEYEASETSSVISF
jgi:hypothetical protein